MAMTTQPPLLNRTDDAVRRLRSEIILGTLVSGAQLAEASLARQLGVSRVPAREALFALEREGLVNFSATGRAYVKQLTPKDFDELYVLRLTLEPLASKLAAPTLRSHPWALEANVAEMENAKSIQDVTRLDLDFHQTILESSGNERLAKMWRSLRSELELWLGRLHRQHQKRTHITRAQTIAEHRAIIDCFRQGSVAACERMITTHLQGWRDWLPNANTVVEGDSS